MSETHPDLVALLRGELSNAEALAAADHARACAPCRVTLVEDALGHGLLSRSRRTLGLDVDPGRADVPTEMPPALSRALRGPRHRRSWLGAAAAVLLLVAGVGVGLGTARALRDDEGSSPTQQTATLEPVKGSATGTVSMGTDHAITQMRLATEKLPTAPRGDFYYAWLLDPRSNKMLPLGQVTPGRVATFEVPESLVAAYSAVDVSLEADDGDPGHSVTSVLRATYADPGKASS
jgi:hypothetical protein